MPRNIDDILPKNTTDKRSIRDIPIPNGRRRTDPVTAATNQIQIKKVESPIPRVTAPMERPIYEQRSQRGDRRKGSGWGVWAGAIAGILVLVFVALSFMRSSTLAYTPKSAPLSFNDESLNAYKSGQPGVLLFSVVKLSTDQSESVAASGDPVQVTKKASGRIIVYNNNSAAQQLVATTRFQSADGTIFRTPATITVPAKTASGPGSLEVTVVADQAGTAGNIGLSDFTVPGFKGTPKFTTVYARAKTAMSGGFSGLSKAVSDDARAAAEADLEAKLKSSLLDQAKAQVPADFILYPDLASIDYADLADSSSTDSSVTMNVRGSLNGVMFKRSDLAAYLASAKLSLPANQAVSVPDLDGLAVGFVGSAPSDLLSSDSVALSVSGNATAVWLVDESALKTDIIGKPKSDLASILANYPGIASASASIRPFWKSSFPNDAKDIKVVRSDAK